MKTPELRRRAARRKGAAGIIAAVIAFAMIFTVGTGFFLMINSTQHFGDQAVVSKEAFLQEAATENLSMYVKLLPSGNIWLRINNTGGVPSTIVSVFVTSPSGVLISNARGTSQPSHYLSEPPDLNVTLPLTLAQGASSSQVSGCTSKKGCDIGIFASSLNRSTTFLVSVLTTLGNVFSVQYPSANHITLKNIVVVGQYVYDQAIVGDTVIIDDVDSVIIDCYGCVTNLAEGGNILVMQIVAKPSPVGNGGTITVNATVWNFSPYTTSKTNVTLSAVYSGTAKISPDISTTSATCGVPTTISSQSPNNHASFICTFVANSGGATGTVTFEGNAIACALTGTTTTCANGGLVSSATAASNPVQVGYIVAYGLWQPDYYYFAYRDTTHTALTPAAVITHTDTNVGLYVKITNIYNQTLYILDGSYMQFISPGTDVDLYVVNSITPATGAPTTLTAYGCTDSPPTVPTDSVSGQNCIAVAPGQTISLTFAASSSDGTSWEWGSSGAPVGASSIGCIVQIILEYAFANNGAYFIYAQDVPFQSVYLN